MADDINARIGIDFDTSEALASLKNLQRQISQFNRQLANGSAANAASAANLNRNLINDINASGKFVARLQTIRSTTENFTNALEKNKFSMGEYFRYGAAASGKFTNKFQKEFSVLEKVSRERVKTLQTQYISLGRDANGALKSISVRPLMLDLNDLGTKQMMVAQRQQIFNQLLKQGSTNLLNFGKNTQWAGRQLMVGFTIPLSIFGNIASKTFMELEEEAIRFRRVYGELFTPPEETDAMLESLRELGREFTKYGVSVSDTLGLAADAAAMGKTGTELLAQVTEATRLSVLGSVDQQQALDTTISLTNAFGIANKDLANNIDFLNAVENQTVTSIEDLTIAIPKAGPVIKQLGGDARDLAFFLTAMKEGGINASEGANALKSGLARIINPTKEASAFLEKFNINVREIVTQNRGDIKATVIELATALDSLDPLNRAQAIERLFGKFQFARISALFQNVIQEGNQASRVLELTNATTQELAQLSAKELGAVTQTTTYQFKRAVEDFQSAVAPVGEEFLKLITPVVEFGTKILDAFNNMSDGAKRTVTTIVTVLGAVAPIALMTFGLVANGVANLIKGFLGLSNIFKRFRGDTNTLGMGLDYMTQEQLQASAAAASLEQSHLRLSQMFTVEKDAVNALAAAYIKAAEAGRRLTAVKAAPTTLKKPPKFADGGLIRGPGTGTSDSIIARVSNGEAIIPAESVRQNAGLVQSLISNNIPKFADGFMGGSRAHLTMPMQGKARSAAIETAGLKGLAQKYDQYIRVVSNLVAELPQKLNKALDMGTATIQDFQAGWASRTGKMTASAKMGGADVGNKKVVAAIKKIEDEIGKRTVQIAQGTKDQKVTDEMLSRATTEVLAKYDKLENEIGQTARAFQNAASQVGQVRVSLPAKIVRSGLAAGDFTKTETGKIMAGNINVARESQSVKNAGKLRPANAIKTPGGYSTQKWLSEAAKIESQNAQATVKNAKEKKKLVQEEKALIEQEKKNLQKRRQQARDPQTGRFVSSQTAATASGAGSATQQAIVNNNAAIATNTGLVSKFGNKITGVSYALTSAAGLLSMFGGDIGDAANKVFMVTAGMTALMEVTRALTGANMAELVQKRAANVKAAMGLGEGSTLFGAATGLGSKLKLAARFVTRFIGPIGLAITAVAGLVAVVKLVNDAKEEERKKTYALADAAQVTADKLNSLESLLGGQAVQTPIESARLAEPGEQQRVVSNARRAEINRIKTSEEFEKNWSDTVESLKRLAAKDARAVLESIGASLVGQGFAAEAVENMIVALQEKSKQTTFDVDVNKFTFNSGEALTNLKQQTQRLTSEFGRDLANSSFGQVTTTVEETSKYVYEQVETVIGLTEKQKARLEGLAGVFGNILTGLSGQFRNGTISAGVFETAFQNLMTSIQNTPDPAAKLVIMDKLLETNLPEHLRETAGEVKNLSDKMLILKAVTLGITDMNLSDLTLDPTVMENLPRIGAARLALAKQVEDGMILVKDINKMIQEFIETGEGEGTGGGGEKSALEQAIEKLIEQRTEIIQNQKAYAALRKEGYSIAQAFELAKDPILAAAIATTKVGTKEWSTLLELIESTNSALTKSGISNLVKQRAGDIQLKKDLVSVLPVLKDMKLSASDIDALLSNPELASELISDLKDGKLDAKDLQNYLKQISMLKKLEIQIQLSTSEGRRDAVDEAFADINNYFSAKENALQVQFDLDTEALQDKIKSDEDLIASYNTEISYLEYQLETIAQKEDEINDKYDARVTALDEVDSINERIASRQRSLLDIATALAQGDIAAAAQAQRAAQAEAAKEAAQVQKDRIEKARESELAALRSKDGRTRAEIEDLIEQKRGTILEIENESLATNKQALELKQDQLDADIKSLSYLGLNQTAWSKVEAATRLARVESDAYRKSIEDSLQLIKQFPEEFGGVELPEEYTGQGEVVVPGGTATQEPIKPARASELERLILITRKRVQSGDYTDAAQKQRLMQINIKRIKELRDIYPATTFAMGGLVPYMNIGGMFKSRGTDTMPAMLTPGEFVMRRPSVRKYGTDMMKALNSGTYNGESVYNYSVNVNVKSDANPEQIARAVMSQIKQVDSQRIRSSRY